ncbi:MAG: hypothetical protein FWF12_00340 [Betaproteobacteria bacterium]|nr:hypothetical protein [Betaproteobacteria bacterium]
MTTNAKTTNKTTRPQSNKGKTATATVKAVEKKDAPALDGFKSVCDALKLRIQSALTDSKRKEARFSLQRLNEKNIVVFFEMGAIAPDNYAKTVSVKEGQTGHVCGKTLMKMSDLTNVIPTNDKRMGEAFLTYLIEGMLENGNQLSVKEMVFTLAKGVENDDCREAVKKKASYTVGTAVSQSSKVRFALAALNLATIIPGKKNDICMLTEKGIALLTPAYGKPK